MRVAALAARHIENARPRGKLQQIDETRDFPAVALEREERLVLEEIMRVEVRRPPVGFRRQKKTGSRYAPYTSSIAARISYNVQYARAQSINAGITFCFARAVSRSVSRLRLQAAGSRFARIFCIRAR
jgi:hypothetical protein